MRIVLTLIACMWSVLAASSPAEAQVQSPTDTVTVEELPDGSFRLTPRGGAFDWAGSAIAIRSDDGSLEAIHMFPEGTDWRASQAYAAAIAAGSSVEELSEDELAELFPGQDLVMEALGNMLSGARAAACSITPRPSQFTTGTDITVDATVIQGTIRFEVSWTGADLCE